MQRFDGWRVVVTGGGTGIGAAVSCRFADEGATVVVAQRTAEEAIEAVRTLDAPGRRLIPVGADLATADGCRELAAAAVDQLGSVDLLVNNASATGRPAVGDIDDFDDDRVDLVIDVGIKAPFRLTRLLLPNFAPGAVVVNISSVAAYTAQPRSTVYAAAKAGLVGLTRGLAFELAERGIRVAHVAPGDIATRGPAVAPEPGPWGRRTPLGRRGLPADVAAAVAWLASEDASFVTGSGVLVDGGWLTY
ncbi:SDR family oxidoreductase [Kribbella hippodromi]|uniref:SDR family oxidoreductase n=1 Tax=Kribbella hippodromi TaxID=434347 RepID=A0ABP4QA16_9ACTN